MNINKDAPSIIITVSMSLFLGGLCNLIGKDSFYQLYSFSVIIVAILLTFVCIAKKNFSNLIIVFIMLCTTETIFREEDSIPYLFSFYFIILVCSPFILFDIKRKINLIIKNSYLLILLMLILLVTLNTGNNFSDYFITFKKLGIPLIAMFTLACMSFSEKSEINFDRIYKYFLFFSLPILLNVNLFGEIYIEPDFTSRIWPPWGDGTGPVAGLAGITMIICIYFILEKKYFFYIVPLLISVQSLFNLMSRGAIIASFISLGIYGFIIIIKSSYRKPLLILMLVLVMIVLPNLNYSSLAENISKRFTDIELILKSEKRSGRMFVLLATIDALPERPIFGGGTGSFVTEITQRVSEFDIITRIHGQGVGDAHSFLLQNLFEHGLLGLILIILFYIVTLHLSFKQQKKYDVPAMTLILFITIYTATTALKHAVMFIPYIFLAFNHDKVHT